MKLADCEISHLHVRGNNVSLIIGDRALSETESGALLAEFAAVYGGRPPAYVSRDGWQLLAKRSKKEAAPVPAAPAEAPAEAVAETPVAVPAPAAQADASAAYADKKIAEASKKGKA